MSNIRLHFHTLHMQEEYHSEGIDSTMVTYTDNRALLELLLSVSALLSVGLVQYSGVPP